MEGTRRRVIGGMAAGAGLPALADGLVSAAHAQTGRKSFVLVHGSSAGAGAIAGLPICSRRPVTRSTRPH